MFSQTRTALEQFDNQHDFERMSADILNALGFKEVVLIAPRGGSDGGRDVTFTTESGGKGLACVTLRKDIDVKFQQDFSQRSADEYDKYFLFCTAHLSAKQKLDFITYCANTLQAEFVPIDIEALRSLLDSALKPIRESYLRIQDNTTIRRKIKQILFDPQNEVELPQGWQMIALTAPFDMIGLFNLIKDQDITMISQTQEEIDVLNQFVDVFMCFRKLCTYIDNYIFQLLNQRYTYVVANPFQKMGKYIKARFLEASKDEAAKAIAMYMGPSAEDCEKLYEEVQEDQDLKRLLEELEVIRQRCNDIRSAILALRGFQVDN